MSTATGDRQKNLAALRGAGEPDNPDVLYGSITRVAPEQETIVGLQEKLLFMMTLLQAADARPTAQAADAVKQLGDTLSALEARWRAMPR